MMNPIIIYYSRSGNTEKIALKAKEDLNCDCIKIEPKDAYGNYISSCIRTTKEKKAPIAPEFVTPIPDLKKYDVILLGYPIWAQDLPRFVSDFISKCDIKGKIIIPFATYGMSDINWTMKHLKELCKEATIKYPFDSGVFKKGNYSSWIKQVKEELDK